MSRALTPTKSVNPLLFHFHLFYFVPETKKQKQIILILVFPFLFFLFKFSHLVCKRTETVIMMLVGILRFFSSCFFKKLSKQMVYFNCACFFYFILSNFTDVFRTSRCLPLEFIIYLYWIKKKINFFLECVGIFNHPFSEVLLC